jgi:hypothetical protein
MNSIELKVSGRIILIRLVSSRVKWLIFLWANSQPRQYMDNE